MKNLTNKQRIILLDLMKSSREKGNLANSAIAIKNNKIIAISESLVVSDNNATAHSERILVEKIGNHENSHISNGYSIVTVVEPCLMCLSACSQANIKNVYYIIPAKQYIKEIPWMSDINNFDKHMLAKKFSNQVNLVYLKNENPFFSKEFEELMEK